MNIDSIIIAVLLHYLHTFHQKITLKALKCVQILNQTAIEVKARFITWDLIKKEILKIVPAIK